MSEYTEQAAKFLTDNGLKFSAEYIEHGKYFPDDKEERDIWKLTLKREGRQMSVRYGQSLSASDHGNTPPTAYDLLAALTKYAPGTFSEFCWEFGYNDDSRTAERTYKAVCREWKSVSRFFTPSQIKALADIN